MAKKDKLDFGEFEMDSNLDWDFDDSPKMKKLKKSSKPIDHFGEGVKESMRSNFTDPSFIKQMFRKALPDGYGKAWDAVDLVINDTKDLYDQASKELRPHLGSISRKLDSMVPDSAKRAKRWTSMLRERLDGEAVNNRWASGEEDATNSGVERMLSDLEQSRQANDSYRDARDQAQGAIRDRVDGKRFESNYKVLGIIANEAMATRQYLQTFDTAFKRKSLELQFRSYAAQSALLNNFVKFAERTNEFQQKLVHNTALPEYAKTTNLQRMKAHGKDALIGKAHDALFGKKSRIGMAGARLMRNGREKLDGLKDMLSMIEDGLDMAADSSDNAREMAEMSGGTHSGWKTAGTFAGGIGSELLGDFISGNIKKLLERHKGITKSSARVGRYALNSGALINKAQKSKWLGNMNKSENELTRGAGSLFGKLFDLLRGEGPDMSIENRGIGALKEDKEMTIRRQMRAQTDIIPGYLARILREVTAIRTGDAKTAMLTFDSKSGKFKTESRMSADIVSSLRKHASESRVGKNTYAEQFSKYRETFVGKDVKASKHDKSIDTFLQEISRSNENFDFTDTGLKETAAYKKLAPGAKKAIDEILSKRFSDSNDHKTELRRGLLTQRAGETRDSISNLKPIIEEYIAEGHEDRLEEAGIIFRNKKGGWEINEDQYYKFFDDTTATSDIDAKTNIRPFGKSRSQASPSKALTAFKNTKLFDWDYKSGQKFNAGPGVTDRKGFMGPMAQDVKRNFGEEAAPGGKALNLVNMNGYTMAAVKGLQEKVEQMGGGEGLKYLADINSGIKKLLGDTRDTASARLRDAGGFEGIKDSALARAKAAKTAVVDKVRNTDIRSENILGQIRDLMAIGKDRKSISGILSRDLDSESKSSFASSVTQKVVDILNDHPQRVTNALLAQLRDLTMADKPKEVLDEIIKRSKDANTLLKIPLVGQSLRRAILKLQEKENADEEDFDLQKSLAGNTQGDIDDSHDGAEAQARANGGNGKGIGGILGAMGGLLGAGKQLAGSALGALGRSSLGKRMRRGKLGALGRYAKNSRLGKQFGKDFSKLGGWKAKAGGALSKMKLRGGGLLGGALTIGSGLLGVFGGGDDKDKEKESQARAPEASGENTYSAADHTRTLAASAGDKVKNAYSNVKGAFGDRDGDGQRDGGAADRMADAEKARQANEERKRASIEASRRGADAKAARNSPADDAIEKMIKVATAGLGGIASIAGDVLGGALNFMGLGKVGGAIKGIGRLGGGLIRGGGSLLGKGASYILRGAPGGIAAAGRAAGGLFGFGAKAVGGIARAGMTAGSWALRGASALGSVTGGVGRAVMGIAGRVPGAANVARAAVTATRVAQVAGLMTGGAGGMVGSALGIIGSAISSSVVVGAAVIAGVAYGGYKLYKYVTRNNIDEWEKIRILQYGLDGTDATKSFNNKILSLEAYLLDGKLAYSNGTPSVNTRATKPEEIADIFDIDKEDQAQASKFASWYADRFQPVFLHHVASLYKVDNKRKLTELDKLEPAQKLDYLGKADIGGVWNYTTSPFKGLDVLSDNPKASKELIDAMIKTQGAKVQEAAKDRIKSGDNKPKGDDAANANKIIASAVKPAAAEPAVKTPAPGTGSGNTNPSLPNWAPAAATSRSARMAAAAAGGAAAGVVANGTGQAPVDSEESKDPPKAPQTDTFDKAGGGGGLSGLKTASGNISDGASGMQFLKMGKDASIDRLHPRMKKHLMGMAQEYGEATGKSILINEGWRTPERQAELFRKYGPGRAAPPGSSLHEFGLAVDINTGITDELEKLGLLRKYGFTRPIRGETWHLEPAGIQQAIQRAKKDSNFADSAIMSSLGRGGGGLGSSPNAKKGGRDPQLAKSLYEAGSGTTVNLSDVAKAATSTQSTGLASPQVNGTATVPVEKMKELSGQGFASKGRGEGVQSSGNFDASASIGDGTGKYDKTKSNIAKYAAEAGADPNKMMMMAAIESSMQSSADAPTSSAKGLMQFVGDTWKEQVGKHGEKYGIKMGDIRDDRAQTILAAKYMEQARPGLQKAAGGRKLEFVDEYMGHFLGPTGGKKMIAANPNEIGAKLLPDQASSNKDIFFDKGGRARTVGEIRAELQSRIDKKAKTYGINLGGGSTPAPAATTAPAATGTTGSDVSTSPTSATAPQTVANTPSIMKNTGSAPTGYDMSTQLPMVNPNKAPLQANSIAGYQLPDNTLPMFTKQTPRDNAAMVRAPAPIATPMAQNAVTSASARATSTTDDLLIRMTTGAETQIKHLASIDETLAGKIVPLLEKVVSNTASGMRGNASAQGDSAPASSGPDRSMKTTLGSSKVKSADKSSFDNRRSVTT